MALANHLGALRAPKSKIGLARILGHAICEALSEHTNWKLVATLCQNAHAYALRMQRVQEDARDELETVETE